MDRAGSHSPHDVAASAIDWWNEAGVDVLVDESPRNWLRAKVPAPVAAPDPTAAPAPSGFPDQLDMFQAYLRDAEDLSFASRGARRVCPSGDPASGLMIVTDMPAAEDCTAGVLLSGETGRLFDRMLAAIGRDRASTYLASLSCFRSPDGRLAGEAGQQCVAVARHHIGIAAPKSLLIFGDSCARALLGLSVMQARGRWHRVPTHAGEIPAIVTFSPAYLLDQPAAKRHAWADLQLLMQGPQA